MKDHDHITVALVAVIAIFAVFAVTTNDDPVPIFHMVKIQGEPYYDTTVLKNLDINENLAADIPALTGTELRSLGEQIIATKEDTSRIIQVLRFASATGPSFQGGKITYTRDERGEVSDFLTFRSDEPMFEYEMIFSPGLKSRIEGNDLIDFEDERINILGGDFNLFKGELRGSSQNIVEIKFIGDSYIEFKDDYTDDIFSSSVKVNGKRIDADVKIRGVKAGNKFILTSLIYRFEPNTKLGGDLYVPPRSGVKKHLREPEGFLTRNFEIIYGGLRSGKGITTTPRVSPSRRGPGFDILAAGNDAYDLQFINNRGQRYKIPLMEVSNGGLQYGELRNPLKYVEGSFNIDQGDYFIVTSREKTSGITNVIEYDGINFNNKKIFLRDLAGGSKEVYFDENGEGELSFGGTNYAFEVSPTSPHPISVDMNHNGNPTSGEAKIIFAGGPKLDLGSSNIAGGAQSMSVTIPSKLFKGESKSDEVTSFTIVNDDGEINMVLSDQPTLDLISQAGYRTGMTNFGALWVLYDRHEPAELYVQFGGAAPSVSTVSTVGGQAQGFVIVTLQLDDLFALAR